jgi:CheY-like chemotaxis protein
MSEKLILIVDDDPSVRNVLSSFFSLEGYSAITAKNGKEGLDKLFKLKPTLVFLDIYMPGVTGLEVIRQIRSIDKYVPVVTITGYDSDDIARDILLSGATDFIRKPINLEYVKRVVASCISKLNKHTDG